MIGRGNNNNYTNKWKDKVKEIYQEGKTFDGEE